MSASTGTIQGTPGSMIRPLLLAVAALIASLAIGAGALGLTSVKSTVSTAAPANVVEAKPMVEPKSIYPTAGAAPTSVGTGTGAQPVRHLGPRAE
ncbi:MAG TPA: hypothetical protein VIK65_02565 [Candidatus Limnocylindrales bacterium]|jgi:hypothetical protein